MRVAMLGWEFPPFVAGGLGVHCYHLTEQLAARGVRIDFFMPDVKEAPTRVPWMKLHRVPDPLVGPYGTMGERAEQVGGFARAVELYNTALVERFPTRERFDVLHAHDWITARAGLELSARTGTPLVFSMHSTEWDRSGGFSPQSWISDIERAAVRGAQRVIAVSGYTRDQLIRAYGARAEAVDVVHNGVEAGKYAWSSEGRDYARRPGMVLFLSRLTPQKGCLQFVWMAERLLGQGLDAHFALGGTGPLRRDIEQEVIERRLHHRINLLGYVPEDDVPALYRRASAYVLPSFSEPFGISALEAAAAGLPVVLSRSTGVAEVLPHALQADYWDTELMAEYVKALLEHPTLAKAMGTAARAVAQRMTWARCAERTHHVYEAATAAA
ncbi:MAG TPA: glycosyltransferase family 4 protein [Candidatus Thermoplasmatota archaeon]|jgi:glycosyltransferase involved in cell wall biosynthesis|nr:glycosyltransferase family 4 protein [Candidatus Thermoplasmatota archaeon]